MATDSASKENGIDSMDTSTSESTDNAKDKNESDEESKTHTESGDGKEISEVNQVESESEENQDKPNDETRTLLVNGIDSSSSNQTKDVENENNGDNATNSNSQNDENEDDDDYFNPLLLCPDISMDVDESPVVTSAGDSGSAAMPSDPTDETNSLFTPLFSTFVDEMTGAEISFNLTSEEQQLREKLYGPNNPIQFSKVHCTACNVHLGSALAGQTNRFVHPLLKVLICKECYHFYTSGEFEKDEDGSELYCRWCGQGGQVLCCTMCEFVFCKKCIRINFGRKKLTEVRDSDEWKCFRCDISQLKALRAMCVEFFEYIRRETARASAVSDPDFINKDLTNCCQAQLKKRLGETEETEKEPKKTKRWRRNEDDPDYSPYTQESEETPDAPVPSTSGLNTTPNVLRPPPPLVPKPTLPSGELKFPGQSPSPTVRIGNTILNVKSTTNFPRGLTPNMTVRAANTAVRAPNTAIRSPSMSAVKPKPTFSPRTPTLSNIIKSPMLSSPLVGSLAASKSTIPKPNSSQTVKHEWFEKTVRAAARVNSNLSYTLTQLNKAQASASSVEQLAVVHNKLQEILSSSINSLIQIRKNLRTEFIAGIKTIRFPPKKPVDPNDDDVIIVNSTNPSVSQVNKNILAGLPQITLQKTPKSSPSVRSTSTNSSSISCITPNRSYLKVKTFSQLQTVSSECITIPDDDPPPNEKDDDPVIVSQNIMPEMEKDPLADEPGSEEDHKRVSDSEKNVAISEDGKKKEDNAGVDKGEETSVSKENRRKKESKDSDGNNKKDKNADEKDATGNEKDATGNEKDSTGNEKDVTGNEDEKEVPKDENNCTESERNCSEGEENTSNTSTDKETNCNKEKENDQVEVNGTDKMDVDDEEKEDENSQKKKDNDIDTNDQADEISNEDETNRKSDAENDDGTRSNDKIENENSESNSSEKLSNGTTSDDGEVKVKEEPEEKSDSYNVKDKPSPKIRRMLSVKVNLKKTPVVENLVKQEPIENGD